MLVTNENTATTDVATAAYDAAPATADQAAQAAGATVVDVRTAAEHQAAAIPGAVPVPLDELRARLDELPAGDLIVYCAVGLRGYLATRVLEQHRAGHAWGRIRNLDGGMRTWQAGVGR